jgi:ribose/xylose/arabinose/galactoside ABC-type transport system permease subunit
MVTFALFAAMWEGPWLLAQAADGAKRLPPPTKAAAQMALLGIALIGLMFVVMILLGGHWVRRQGTGRRGPVVPADRAPLVKDSPQRLDEHDEGEE